MSLVSEKRFGANVQPPPQHSYKVTLGVVSATFELVLALHRVVVLRARRQGARVDKFRDPGNICENCLSRTLGIFWVSTVSGVPCCQAIIVIGRFGMFRVALKIHSRSPQEYLDLCQPRGISGAV